MVKEGMRIMGFIDHKKRMEINGLDDAQIIAIVAAKPVPIEAIDMQHFYARASAQQLEHLRCLTRAPHEAQVT